MGHAVPGAPQMLTGGSISTVAALHPDWQLLLDTLFTALTQPSVLAENLVSACFLDHLDTLTLQVNPDNAAQRTAAAIVCQVSAVQIEEAPTQQRRILRIAAAVSPGRMNGVMKAMMSGLRVR